MARSVHLVGSVPLDSSAEVFRAVGGRLGPYVSGLPDGETGVRSNWIYSQVAVLGDHPDLASVEPVPSLGRPDDPGRPQKVLQFGRRVADAPVAPFPALGYRDAATSSYATFVALRDEGVIPAHTRFQVSLPTPWAPVRLYVRAGDRDAVLGAYRPRFLADLADLLAHVPHDDLAIQWDVAIEIAEIEGALDTGRAEPVEPVVDELVELVSAIPPEVEAGVHFCYGNSGGVHFVQPRDLGTVVALANGVGARAGRRLSWIHMPVPRDRDDDAYVAPLADLDPTVTDRVHLGVVHLADGLAGAARRIGAASAHLADFGVATECGWGQLDRTSVDALLDLHVAVASA